MDADILQQADTLSEEELDRLPFGMIQLDAQGRILKFNATEAELGRVAKGEAVGRSFFDEVAPCTKVRDFYGRFVEGFARRELNELFPYQFRFRDGRRRDVVIAMYYSAGSETVWVLVQRP